METRTASTMDRTRALRCPNCAGGAEGEQAEADEPDGGGQAVDEGQPVDGHQQEAAEGGEDGNADGDAGGDLEPEQAQAGDELVKTGFTLGCSGEDVGA
jgi:hypothetical protein